MLIRCSGNVSYFSLDNSWSVLNGNGYNNVDDLSWRNRSSDAAVDKVRDFLLPIDTRHTDMSK